MNTKQKSDKKNCIIAGVIPLKHAQLCPDFFMLNTFDFIVT